MSSRRVRRGRGNHMIKTTFDIGEVADAVSFWIPGFRCGDATQNVSAGDHAEYRLRCTRNELIDDFDVVVEAVSDSEARVTVTGMDGRSAERMMPLGDDGALGSIHGPMVPMAVEELPTRDGGMEYTVSLFTGKRSGMAWVRDGMAYRTIHDHGGVQALLRSQGELHSLNNYSNSVMYSGR